MRNLTALVLFIAIIFLFSSQRFSIADPIFHEKAYPVGSGPFPAVITLHTSGGFKMAKALIENFKSKTYVNLGYAVYSPDFFKKHRIKNANRMDTFDKYREDIERELIEIISLMKADPKIDKKNIFAVGFSNGGFWASFLAGSASVNAGVSHYGVWKANKGRDRWNKYPMKYFSKTSKPILALHGSSDGTQKLKFAVEAWKQIKSSSGKIENHIYDGAGHAWDCKKCRKFNSWNEEVTKDSLQRTLVFFEKHTL